MVVPADRVGACRHRLNLIGQRTHGARRDIDAHSEDPTAARRQIPDRVRDRAEGLVPSARAPRGIERDPLRQCVGENDVHGVARPQVRDRHGVDKVRARRGRFELRRLRHHEIRAHVDTGLRGRAVALVVRIDDVRTHADRVRDVPGLRVGRQVHDNRQVGRLPGGQCARTASDCLPIRDTSIGTADERHGGRQAVGHDNPDRIARAGIADHDAVRQVAARPHQVRITRLADGEIGQGNDVERVGYARCCVPVGVAVLRGRHLNRAGTRERQVCPARDQPWTGHDVEAHRQAGIGRRDQRHRACDVLIIKGRERDSLVGPGNHQRPVGPAGVVGLHDRARHRVAARVGRRPRRAVVCDVDHQARGRGRRRDRPRRAVVGLAQVLQRHRRRRLGDDEQPIGLTLVL